MLAHTHTHTCTVHWTRSKRLKEKIGLRLFIDPSCRRCQSHTGAHTRTHERLNYVIFYDDEILSINIALCRLVCNRIYSRHNLHIIFYPFEPPLSLGFNMTTSAGNRRLRRRRCAALYRIRTHTHIQRHETGLVIIYQVSTVDLLIDGRWSNKR